MTTDFWKDKFERKIEHFDLFNALNSKYIDPVVELRREGGGAVEEVKKTWIWNHVMMSEDSIWLMTTKCLSWEYLLFNLLMTFHKGS